MKLQKRSVEAVLNLIGSLQGTAWKLVESFDVTKIDEEKSFDDVISILDAAFRYDARVRMPQDFDAYFNLSRRPGTTLLNFVTEHDEKLRKLAEHGVKLPDQMQGWILLRRANLTKEQRQLVLSQAPKLEKLRVQEALFVILGQDYKQAVSQDRPQHRFPGKPFHRGKAYAAQDDQDFDEPEVLEEAYYEYDENYEGDDPSWIGDESFDGDAAYFHEDDDAFEGSELGDNFDVESYDMAYAAYLDARRRFQDLKLSRGFLPVVALIDQGAASPTSTGSNSPSKGKGYGKKGGKGKGKARSSTTVRYPPRGDRRAPDPKGRASAVLQCLRCGAYGHQAAQCPRPAKHSGSTSAPASPSKKQHIEGMAVTCLPSEHGHVIFEDLAGRPRVDCTMLDPGASAFLMGSGPFHRYVDHLRQLGFDVNGVAMTKTSRTFHFGGDHSTTSHWIARVPVFINNSFDYVHAFIIAGETPMLLGRPIIESLGIVINFKRQQMMFEGHDWRQIIVGRHGEYLLSLTEDFDAELASQPPSFDLSLDDQSQASDGSTSQPSQVLDFQTYQRQEKVFLGSDAPQCLPGERNVLNKHWKMFENALVTEEKRVHATVTRELNDPEVKPRVIWEVYAGESRMSQIAETLGCHVESFGYETGWDFDLPSQRKAFMMRLNMEMPDEVFLAPRCGLWSRMQAINATTPEKKESLQQQRDDHHRNHLKFVKEIYLSQVHGGRQAHIEQPHGALSWLTSALKNLPGLYAIFDQCCYGACCLDSDGIWKPVQKTTGILSTKKALVAALCLRCDKSHEHCRLEGQFPGIGRTRTSYMEDYQPGLAASIAAAWQLQKIHASGMMRMRLKRSRRFKENLSN